MGRVECAVDSLLAAVGQEGRAGLVCVRDGRVYDTERQLWMGCRKEERRVAGVLAEGEKGPSWWH